MKESDEAAATMDNAENTPSSASATQNEEMNAVASETSSNPPAEKEDTTSTKTVEADSKSVRSVAEVIGEPAAAAEELTVEVEEDAKSTPTVDTESNLPLPATVEAEGDANATTVQVGRTPKRILHFSDGVLEEYSSDEDDDDKKEDESASRAVDTRKLTWPKYILYATMLVGSKSLKACDYVGEGLANFFGITTPKYQFEISEYEKMKKEEEEEKKKEDLEMRGWTQGEPPASNVVTAETLSSGDASSAVTQPQRY